MSPENDPAIALDSPQAFLNRELSWLNFAARVIALDPWQNRTFHYWHVFVPGLVPGQLYGFRVSGPFAPERGLSYDPEKVLLDPYGRAVAVPPDYSR